MLIMAVICATNNLHLRFMLRMSVSQFDYSRFKLTVMISIEYRYGTHARVPREPWYETSGNVLFDYLPKIGGEDLSFVFLLWIYMELWLWNTVSIAKLYQQVQ